MNICVYIYIRIYIYVYVYICTHICSYVYIYIYTYIYICVYIYILVFMYIYIYRYFCVYTYIYIYGHTHIHLFINNSYIVNIWHIWHIICVYIYTHICLYNESEQDARSKAKHREQIRFSKFGERKPVAIPNANIFKQGLANKVHNEGAQTLCCNTAAFADLGSMFPWEKTKDEKTRNTCCDAEVHPTHKDLLSWGKQTNKIQYWETLRAWLWFDKH